MKKIIVFFLLTNFVVAASLLSTLKNRASSVSAQSQEYDSQHASVLVAQQEPEKAAPAQEILEERVHNKKNKTNSSSTAAPAPKNVENSNNPLLSPNKGGAFDDVCMEYGPLSVEQRAIFDSILKKENVSFIQNKKNKYEVYWNLGPNEEQARELFERQKQGPLQEQNFQLAKDEGNWIVSIAIMEDSLENAKAIASKLGEKASKVNAGGRWQYRTLPEAYYYKINNLQQLSASGLAYLSKVPESNKNKCS